jgi:hypothetical protein
MQDATVLMGLFQDVGRVADTLDKLREVGLADDDITVLSSVPYSHEMLGRPHKTAILPYISLASAVAGLLVGIFYAGVTPNLYVIPVGGQPTVPAPPTAVLLYAFTMVFLIIGTFVGMLWLNGFPSFEPQYYDSKLPDGRIGLVLRCAPEHKEAARAVLEAQKAENIHEAKRRSL